PVALFGLFIIDFAGFFFFSSRRRHTSWPRDWSSDVCSSDLVISVQDVVGDENYMASLEALTQWRDHFLIQILKIALRRLQERSFKRNSGLEMQANSRKLKPQATQ